MELTLSTTASASAEGATRVSTPSHSSDGGIEIDLGGEPQETRVVTAADISLGEVGGEPTRIATPQESEPQPETSPASEATRVVITNDDGATRVDLGDDLLEKTAVLAMPDAAKEQGPPPLAPSRPQGHSSRNSYAPRVEAVPTGPIRSEDISDHLESARILMGENLVEDAKRLLRRILLADPHRVAARQMLEEIHEIELRQIFGDSDLPRRKSLRGIPETAVERSADAVMRDLDRDLGLETFDESARPSLFRDRAAMDRFGEEMDREFAASPPAERVDLGIAFLEMGLHDLAARHFRAAVSTLALEAAGAEVSDPAARRADGALIAATGLLAYALILGGRAFDATLALQPLLNDVDVERERKLDLLYLMGRAFEAMGKPAEARSWYALAAEIEPHYRDIDERAQGQGKR